MSVAVIGPVHSAEAQAASAALRLAAAIGQDRPSADASPIRIEQGHAVVAAARVALAQADVAVRAGEAVTAPGGVVV